MTRSGVYIAHISNDSSHEMFWADIPHHHCLERKRAKLSIVRHLLHDRHKASKLIAAAVSDNSRHTCGLHLSVLIVQSDKTNAVVLSRQRAYAVFDHLRNM
jgi:hypothetical protein